MVALTGLVVVPFVFILPLVGRHKRPSLRDLLPPLHLAESSPLRRSVMWRADGKCGEAHPVRVKGLSGNDTFVPAGCNPRGKKPCCSRNMHCGPVSFEYCGPWGSVNYVEDDDAFHLQLLMLTQVLGPRAREFDLKGYEWRQDFLCGPGVMTMEWSSEEKVELRQAACNPDSPDRYMCDLELSSCTSSRGVGEEESPIRKSGWRPDTLTLSAQEGSWRSVRGRTHSNRTIDYRKRESWDARRALPLPLEFDIKEHMIRFKNSIRITRQSDGNMTGMLVEDFSQKAHERSSVGHTEVAAIDLPHWYYINLDSHAEKGRQLERSLLEGGVQPSDITRISAATPDHVRNNSWHVSEKKWNGVAWAVTLSHLKAIRQAWEDNKIRAKKGLSKRTAIIVEDDLSMELVSMWKIPPSRVVPQYPPAKLIGTNFEKKERHTHSITLHDVLQDLEKTNKNWEICQLSTTCFFEHECYAYAAEMATALSEHHLVLQRQSNGRHRALWGAVAYAVSPRGQAAILDRLWPGSKEGPTFAKLPMKAKFRVDEQDLIVADSLLFKSTHPRDTYFSARPLFCSKTDHSHLHSDHLRMHRRSKYLLESVLYLGHHLGNRSTTANTGHNKQV